MPSKNLYENYRKEQRVFVTEHVFHKFLLKMKERNKECSGN